MSAHHYCELFIWRQEITVDIEKERKRKLGYDVSDLNSDNDNASKNDGLDEILLKHGEDLDEGLRK